MSNREFDKEITDFKTKVNETGHFTLELLLEQVLNPIAHMQEVYEESWTDVHAAGRTLRRASYAGCMLGHEASPGDVELHLISFDDEVDDDGQALFPPALYKGFRAGDRMSLITVFNDELLRASEMLSNLPKHNCKYNIVHNAPSPWFSEKPNIARLNFAVLGTYYHTYVSLLRLIELESGTA